MNQLHVKGNKSVPRIAHQKNHMGSGQFSRRHEIFAANPFPDRRLHSLFGEIMRKNHAWNVWLMVTIRPERKRFARSFAKIGAEKSPDPGASAFRHRNDDCVPTGQLAGAAAKIPSSKTAAPSGVRGFSRDARDFVQQLDVTLGKTFQRITPLDQFAPAQPERSPLLRAADQAAERFDPVVLGFREKTIFAV